MLARRVEKALIATGKSGLSEMAEDETTEVVCNFCHKNIISQKKRFKKCSKEFKIKFTSA